MPPKWSLFWLQSHHVPLSIMENVSVSWLNNIKNAKIQDKWKDKFRRKKALEVWNTDFNELQSNDLKKICVCVHYGWNIVYDNIISLFLNVPILKKHLEYKDAEILITVFIQDHNMHETASGITTINYFLSLLLQCIT